MQWVKFDFVVMLCCVQVEVIGFIGDVGLMQGQMLCDLMWFVQEKNLLGVCIDMLNGFVNLMVDCFVVQNVVLQGVFDNVGVCGVMNFFEVGLGLMDVLCVVDVLVKQGVDVFYV